MSQRKSIVLNEEGTQDDQGDGLSNPEPQLQSSVAPTTRVRKQAPAEALRKRFAAWQVEDPSSLITKRIEKLVEPLQSLVAMIVPESIVRDALSKSLWAAEAMTDRADVLKSLEVSSLGDILSNKTRADQCDTVASTVQSWGLDAGARFGDWESAGALNAMPALASLLTLSFRVIKKIGLCFGFDTSSHLEERVVLEILVAATSLSGSDKAQVMKNIKAFEEKASELGTSLTREQIEEAIVQVSPLLASNLVRRRALVSLPALGAFTEASINAWILRDVSLAARNIYALRCLQFKHDARQQATLSRKAAAKARQEQREADAAAAAAAATNDLPKAA